MQCKYGTVVETGDEGRQADKTYLRCHERLGNDPARGQQHDKKKRKAISTGTDQATHAHAADQNILSIHARHAAEQQARRRDRNRTARAYPMTWRPPS